MAHFSVSIAAYQASGRGRGPWPTKAGADALAGPPGRREGAGVEGHTLPSSLSEQGQRLSVQSAAFNCLLLQLLQLLHLALYSQIQHHLHQVQQLQLPDGAEAAVVGVQGRIAGQPLPFGQQFLPRQAFPR